MKITIIRTSINSNSITGELYVNNQYICQTLEHLYRENQKNISCIPENTYGGILRYDHKDTWRIELTGTEPRTHIQIHTGNSPADIKGCILVGESVDLIANKIMNSVLAYTRLKHAFYGTLTPMSTPVEEIVVEIKMSPGPVPNRDLNVNFKNFN